jgi:hypothetical protein
MAVLGDEKILRLQVAVHDAGPVRRREAVRNLHRNRNRALGGDAAARQRVAHRLAAKQLGDEVGNAVFRADVMNGKNIGMVQRRRRTRFLLEATHAVGITRHLRRQHLDRHFALEPRVARPIDLAHPARAEWCNDFVGTEPCVGRKRHGRELYPASPVCETKNMRILAAPTVPVG